VSPIAQALLKAHVGDVVKLQTPKGLLEIEVLNVTYPSQEDKP
jgi:transcription elongation factor GreB